MFCTQRACLLDEIDMSAVKGFLVGFLCLTRSRQSNETRPRSLCSVKGDDYWLMKSILGTIRQGANHTTEVKTTPWLYQKGRTLAIHVRFP